MWRWTAPLRPNSVRCSEERADRTAAAVVDHREPYGPYGPFSDSPPGGAAAPREPASGAAPVRRRGGLVGSGRQAPDPSAALRGRAVTGPAGAHRRLQSGGYPNGNRR